VICSEMFSCCVCCRMCCPGCLLQWVRCCSGDPFFAMFVGSVSHIRVAVKFVYAVRVAVGVWKGVLRCIL